MEFNIAATALSDALNQFAQQSDRQIVFATDTTAGSSLKPRGRYRPLEALDELLRDTGLSYRVGADNTIVVTSANPATTDRDVHNAVPAKTTNGPDPCGYCPDRHGGCCKPH